MKSEDVREACGRETVLAVERAGRTAVINLLFKYSAKRVSDLSTQMLCSYLDEVQALQPPPVPESSIRLSLPVKFMVGDRVCEHDAATCVKGVVTGYEVRYVVQEDGHGPPGFARRGEKLKHAPIVPAPAPPSAPYDFTELYQACMRAEKIIGTGSVRAVLFKHSGETAPSRLKVQDVNVVIRALQDACAAALSW